jgi:hypothetical protein
MKSIEGVCTCLAWPLPVAKDFDTSDDGRCCCCWRCDVCVRPVPAAAMSSICHQRVSHNNFSMQIQARVTAP